MCFTIEPMVNLGRANTLLDKEDNWTVYTLDGKRSAQWEHTLLVTRTGCEILTLHSDDTIPRHLQN
jgi:methionyl aminopeptidase